jgi:ABC-type Fe3+ transport system permease subunit
MFSQKNKKIALHYKPAKKRITKQQVRTLLQSCLYSILAFLIIKFMTGILYDVLYSPVTMTYETKRSGGVAKISEKSIRARNATSLTMGSMAGLIMLFVSYSLITQKQIKKARRGTSTVRQIWL